MCIRDRGRAVCVCHAHGVKDQCGNIRNNDAHQNRDDLKHSSAPDIENDDRNQGNEGEKPVGGSIIDGGTGKTQPLSLIHILTLFAGTMREQFGMTKVIPFIAAFVGVNGVVEAIVCFVIGTAVSMALKKALRY